MVFKWWAGRNEQPKTIEATEVHCQTCGVRLLKERSKRITDRMQPVFYCAAHAPKYDKRVAYGFNIFYYRETEVDINGEPIGYVKKEAHDEAMKFINDEIIILQKVADVLDVCIDSIKGGDNTVKDKGKGKGKGMDKMPKGKCK